MELSIDLVLLKFLTANRKMCVGFYGECAFCAVCRSIFVHFATKSEKNKKKDKNALDGLIFLSYNNRNTKYIVITCVKKGNVK